MPNTQRRHPVQLSVVVPAYNEAATLEQIVSRLERVPVDKEIIVVDDCSSDDTPKIAARLAAAGRISWTRHEHNQGKGAALRTGFARARGEFVVVQDADLEYDPDELPRLMEPLLAGKADVVFGSRFSGGESHRVLYFWHSVGNWVLTLASNMFTDVNLTDMETCYKLFRREVIQSIVIEESRFGFEPEITAKVARGGYRIYESGISYSGRTYAEGKKIGWRDGARAFYCILKYNLRPAALTPRPSPQPTAAAPSADSDDSDDESDEIQRPASPRQHTHRIEAASR